MSRADDAKAVTTRPEEFLSITVMENNMMLFHINGADPTPELENELKNLGLRCGVQFKSPCG